MACQYRITTPGSSASSVVNTGHSGVDGTISTAGLPGIVTTVRRVPPAMMRATTRKHILIRDYEIFSLNDDEAISLFQISLNDSVFLLIMGGAHKLINTSAQNLFPNVL